LASFWTKAICFLFLLSLALQTLGRYRCIFGKSDDSRGMHHRSVELLRGNTLGLTEASPQARDKQDHAIYHMEFPNVLFGEESLLHTDANDREVLPNHLLSTQRQLPFPPRTLHLQQTKDAINTYNATQNAMRSALDQHLLLTQSIRSLNNARTQSEQKCKISSLSSSSHLPVS
jgi:hypothetical protein